MTSCSSNLIYTTQLNKENATPNLSLISIIIILLFQLLITILIICYGYRKYKKFVIARNTNSIEQQL